jgi:ribosomal protein S18 acetylase RimI-like enzyme
VAFVRRRKRARLPTLTATGERFEIKDGVSVATPVALSALFDPFLPHLMRVARAAKHRVAIAKGASGKVLGVAIDDPGARIGTIFAPDSDVCEALRRTINESEFFSDVRHPGLASVTRRGLASPPEAYNVYETYEVMQLDARPQELGYDTELIARMESKHRDAVVQLLEAAYGVPCAAWVGAAIENGDLAWVAEENGRVIGVAMANVVGDRARLHTLTVHAEARNRGIGTALYRARLRALFDMGVASVLTECAPWNVGALALARSHGFTKASVMYIESARDQRDARKFVRR